MKKILFFAVFVFTCFGVFAQEPIAVFPFEDMDNVLTRSEMVMFYHEFNNEFRHRSPANVTIVPRQDVERLINVELAFQLSDFSAREKTAEMNRVLNGTQILSGRIARIGGSIRITVSLYTYPELAVLPGGATLSGIANTVELFRRIPELVQQMQSAISSVGGQTVPEGFEWTIVGGRTVTITKYTGDAMSFDKTVNGTVNGVTYTAQGFDIWDDFTQKGPVILNLAQREMRPHSVTVHSANEWRNVTGNISVTLERPSNANVVFFLMVK